jgi:hypothetical protein
MKYTKFTILFLLLSFCAFNTLDAQVKTKSKNWKSPTFTIDIAGGVAVPLQETKGNNIGEFFTFKNYGTKIGFNGGFNLKFGLGPQGQYRPYVTLGYTQMQNSDDQNSYIDDNYINNGYPLQNNQFYDRPV